MKTAIQIILTIAILALGYLCWESIQKPVRFNETHQMRQEKVIERLQGIREAQRAYKSVYGKFTGSFDTLINFINNDSLALIHMEGRLTDSMIEEGMTELRALKMGIIQRDTIYVAVKDSLFGKNFVPDSLRYVPFTNKEEFEMEATTIKTASGVEVPVFEAKVHNNTYLKGLDEQLIINLNEEAKAYGKYPGLKVGSLTEANNSAGNWE
ncbi:hypothetical protein [Anaerophaga thermohalophila]|uniref:hypothetical protein n=1 Tax=Anaerophaga thermohalophila TaxID=177400 RepID=UPI000237BD18|nr:hypothetical protein [Anaerophaga thermohalophila]